ncbi:hypothetical protein [Alteromonas facilis]|uniref:hypothetical protein n=1 Tax=Alteromonas facilis TaxID=2048004 RepID=UPI000C28E9D3|nr:hypothetical protein [Alteromonas facilis]
MNYQRYFAGYKLLPKQRLVSAEALGKQYRGAEFGDSIVSDFNRLTEKFNWARSRADQEQLLDKRQQLMLHAVRATVSRTASQAA